MFDQIMLLSKNKDMNAVSKNKTENKAALNPKKCVIIVPITAPRIKTDIIPK